MNTSVAANETSDIYQEALDDAYNSDIMSTAKKMHYITSAFCGPAFVILGLAGNTLSIIIWQKKSMRSSTGMYLIAQAVNDIGVLIFFFLSDSLVVLVPEVKRSYMFGVFHSYVGWPMFYFFVINSIWTLVGVTVNRYIQVCWIKHAQMMCNEGRATAGIGLITVMSFLINMPHFNTYYPVPDEARDPGAVAYEYTEFGGGTSSKLYEFWVHCMFLVLAPWVTIMFMNMTILCRTTSINRNMNQYRGQKAKLWAQRKENQLTKLLLTLTFTFLVLIAIQCITQCFFMLQPKIANMRIVNEVFSVAKLGIIVNSSINFLLYCVSGERFRKELRLTLQCCGLLLPVPESSEMSASREEGRSQTSTGSSIQDTPTLTRIDTPYNFM